MEFLKILLLPIWMMFKIIGIDIFEDNQPK